MTFRIVRTFTVATAASLVLFGSAAAQDAAALADGYDAEAARHTAQAQAISATPLRGAAAFAAADHHRREAARNAALARAMHEPGAQPVAPVARPPKTADDHAAMAQAFRGTRMAQAAEHCDRRVKELREAPGRLNESGSPEGR